MKYKKAPSVNRCSCVSLQGQIRKIVCMKFSSGCVMLNRLSFHGVLWVPFTKLITRTRSRQMMPTSTLACSVFQTI